MKDNLHFANSGVIWIYGEIEEKLSIRVCKCLHYILTKELENIYIFISSEGGDCQSAISIIDFLEIAKKTTTVRTICLQALSAAADIMVVGATPGYRFGFKNMTMMFHPESYSLELDYVDKHKQFIDYQNRKDKDIGNMVAKACKKTYSKFKSDIENSLWLDAPAALRYKAIDKIIGSYTDIFK